MRRLVSSVLVGGLVLAALLAGCGGGGGGGGNGGGGGGEDAFVISGEVVYKKSIDDPSESEAPLPNVSIRIGNLGSGLERTALTDANGRFSITLPDGMASVEDMYPSVPHDFGVSYSSADGRLVSAYYYKGINYPRMGNLPDVSIPLGNEVFQATSSTSLGKIFLTEDAPAHP